MDYKLYKKNDQYSIEMTFSAAEYSAAKDTAYKMNASKYNVQGFRKGKAPKSIIEKNYGDVFNEPAVRELFGSTYITVLRENKEIKPIDHPEISVKESDGGLTISAVIDVEPVFTLGKYTGLEIKKENVKITDKEVYDYLKRVAESRARQLAAEKDHKIALGDIVVIDFVGSVNGVEFDGGSAKKHELEIGSHSFIDTFEDQLIGHKIDDKVDVNVTFPKDYHAKSLAGAKALFKVEIKNILIKQLPEINDNLAKEVSEFETLSEFKKDIISRLEKNASIEAARADENNLFKAIADQTKLTVPQKMINSQLRNMMYDIEHNLVRQGLDMQMYLNYIGKTKEEFEAHQRIQAEIAVKSRLIFDAIMEKENITVSKEEINAEVARISEANKKKETEYTKSSDRMAYIEQELMFAKLVKFLTERNKFV